MCYLPTEQANKLHTRQEVAKNSHKNSNKQFLVTEGKIEMDILLAANKQKNECVEICHSKKTNKLW